MSHNRHKIEKLYYSIGEVAEMFGVSNSLLRYWESEFNIIKPRKTSNGNRLYTKKDIDTIKIIYHLVKEKGFTLDGAKKKLKESGPNKLQVNVDVSEKLKSLKEFLSELKDQI